MAFQVPFLTSVDWRDEVGVLLGHDAREHISFFLRVIGVYDVHIELRESDNLWMNVKEQGCV